MNHQEKQDFILWTQFLTRTSQRGTIFNLISVVDWDIGIHTDTSSHGLGGYNPSTSIGWRYQLSKKIAKHLHINVKEFVSTLIGIWLELTVTNMDYARILCLSDNNSAVGWLQKSNFDSDKQSRHDTVVMKLASLLLEHDTTMYPLYIKGDQNVISDALSRDFHLSDKKLTFALTSLFPTQPPTGLTLLPSLPNEITSWVE